MRCAGSRGIGLQGPLDQFKDFGFFSGFNEVTGGLGKGFTGSQKDRQGCYVQKDRRLLYKSVSKDFSPNKQNGDTCAGMRLGTG